MAKTKIRSSIFIRLLVIAVSAYMIFTLVNLWTDLNKQQNELASLKNELNVKKANVEELKDLLNNGSEKQIVEKAARQRLGFVYSNEEIYVDISGK